MNLIFLNYFISFTGGDRQGDGYHDHVQIRGTDEHRRSADRVLRRRVQGNDATVARRKKKSLAFE